MTKETLELVALDIQTERRRRNNQLLDYVEGRAEVYNGEDLMREVAALNCAYNVIAELRYRWSESLYKDLISLIAYSITLSIEVDGEATVLFSIIDKIFDDNSPGVEE